MVSLKKVRKYLNSETLISLYYSFIYPYLIYCNHVWGNTCKSNMNSVVLLQKKIIRIICGVKPREHTDTLYIKLKLLKCEDINKYLLSRLMYRIHHSDITMIDGYFIKNSNIHNYNTRQSDHYHVPNHRGRCCRWWQDSLWAPAIICIYSGSKPHNHVDLLYLFVCTSETRYVEGWCQFLLDLATISWFILCSLMHISAAPLCLVVAKHGTNLHWLTRVV